MAGLYWIPNVFIFGSICNIPHRSLCDNCDIAVSFPRTRKRNCEQIFLAIDNRRNYIRRTGHRIDKPVLNKTDHKKIPRTGIFFINYIGIIQPKFWQLLYQFHPQELYPMSRHPQLSHWPLQQKQYYLPDQ